MSKIIVQIIVMIITSNPTEHFNAKNESLYRYENFFLYSYVNGRSN